MSFENYEDALLFLKKNKEQNELRKTAIHFILQDIDSIVVFLKDNLYINNSELIYVKDIYINNYIVIYPSYLKSMINLIDNIDHYEIYKLSKIFPSLAYEYINFLDDQVKRDELIKCMCINFNIACSFLKFKSKNTKERLMVINNYIDDEDKFDNLFNSITVNDDSRKLMFEKIKSDNKWINRYINNLDVILFDEEKRYIHDSYQIKLFNKYSKNTKSYIEYCIIFRNCLNQNEISLLIVKITDNPKIDSGYIINIVNNVIMSEDEKIKLESILVLNTLSNPKPLSLILKIIN